MRIIYIHELPDWPHFRWNRAQLAEPLAQVRHDQGRLLGQLEALGFDVRTEASLTNLTLDVVKTSEIEGERLDAAEVRSSIARRLGMDTAGLKPAGRDVEGVVEMMLDATGNFASPLTFERLFGWQSALFPAGRSGMAKIVTGAWRSDDAGPMEVVSGALGRERVHFRAPEAARLHTEMTRFIDWFNTPDDIDLVFKAAEAHLWFVTVHPFEDGNGRIARALANMALARSEKSSQRFYSMSAQIRAERTTYYDVLEATQKGSLEITSWMTWFLECLRRAIHEAQTTLQATLARARFWDRTKNVPLNSRQRLVLDRLLDGFQGKLTTSKYAKLAKCSQDTAHRDIVALVEANLLSRSAEGGRSTSYALVLTPDGP